MSTKPVLKSGRNDIRALDELYVALDRIYGREGVIRVLRFYCQSQGITAKDIFPEIFLSEQRK